MKNATILSSQELLSTPKRFVHELLRMPSGEVVDWYYVDTPPSVMIVPVTEDGRVVFVRQYRHNLRDYTLEFPAGLQLADESPEQAARRELFEETGCTVDRGEALASLKRLYCLPSETNKYIEFFIAWPVSFSSSPSGDSSLERYFDMSVTTLTTDQAFAALGGEIRGVETFTALTLASQELKVRTRGDVAERHIS